MQLTGTYPHPRCTAAQAYTRAAKRWTEFTTALGLPLIVMIDRNNPAELLWGRKITGWFFHWWIMTRYGQRGPGLMQGDTILANLAKANALLGDIGYPLPEQVYAFAKRLAHGHDALLIDMVGALGTNKAPLAVSAAVQDHRVHKALSKKKPHGSMECHPLAQAASHVGA